MRVHTSACLEFQRSPERVRPSSCQNLIGCYSPYAPLVAIRLRYGCFALSHDVRKHARKVGAAIITTAPFIAGGVCRWIAAGLDLASACLSPLRWLGPMLRSLTRAKWK